MSRRVEGRRGEEKRGGEGSRESRKQKGSGSEETYTNTSARSGGNKLTSEKRGIRTLGGRRWKLQLFPPLVPLR